jgi:putative acetyltransferase
MTQPIGSSTGTPPSDAPDGLRIRPVRPEDRALLADIWRRSASATHAFLAAGDIEALLAPTRAYLADADDLWVLADVADVPVGFMGLSDTEIESLFLAPEVHRRGAGRRLVQHAADLRGELVVEVNEQNVAAVRFYEACGFALERRSELDDAGRPFPILLMRRPADARRRG